MSKRARVWTVACLLAAACQNQNQNQSPNQSQSQTPGVFWQGASDGWRWSWTATDVTAVKDEAGQKRSFSLAARLRPEFDRDMAQLRADADEATARKDSNAALQHAAAQCTREADVAVLSIVGSLLSYRETRYTSCAAEAHPDGETVYATINVAVAGERSRVVLDALFPQAAIATALRADKLVQEGLGKTRAGTGLAELVTALAQTGAIVTSSECYAFPPDLLARFAFHHVSDGRVAVRIGVPGAATCREQLTQIGIMLPVPQPLAGPLALAAAQSEGLLMQQAETIPGKTHWMWRSGD